jgi:metacaspase-1
MRYIIALCLMLAGCATQTPTVTPVPDPVVTDKSNVTVHAVCFGLTSVADVPEYANWDGSCPGCDLDSAGLNKLFLDHGIESELYQNEQVTKKNFEAVILAAARDLKRDDLLIVALSGHGGQTPDKNGDESDGQDETLVLWDGTMLDDYVMSNIIQKLPAGLRVVLITDTCHSEGNFRAFVRATKRIASFGLAGKKKGFQLQKKGKKAEQDIQLIQLAGCREASYSYGSETGGTWTQTLLETFGESLSWQQWFNAAAKKMPSNQSPQWVEYGNVTDTFRNGEALE